MKYFTAEWYKANKDSLTTKKDIPCGYYKSARVPTPEKMLDVSFKLSSNPFSLRQEKVWKNFEERNTSIYRPAHTAYVEELKGISPFSKEIVLKSLLMHECHLLEICEKDSRFILRLKEGDKKYNLNFKNYKILSPLKNTFDLVWKYEEVYELDKGYEYHILFADCCNNPHTLTLFAEKIQINKER